MIKAKDIMHKSTPILSFESTVNDAILYFEKNNTSFVVVQAAEDRFHGILTEGGLVRAYLRYQAQQKNENLIFYRDLFEPLQLIQENEVFPQIVKKLVTASGHRVFVINSKGHLIGYINPRNILPFFSGPAMKQQEEGIQTEELKSQLYMYESFFAKSPFMMHSVNQDGVIQMANEILHSALGYEFGKLVGKTIFDLYPEEYHKSAQEGLKRILDKGYHSVVRSQMIHKNNKKIEVELVSRVLTDQNDHPIGTITISRPMDMEYLLGCWMKE